jgi:hypothetical protein
MARRRGLSQTAVSRIWRAFALQPHRVETFKLSKDPLFIEKVRDIVGLYLQRQNPPQQAIAPRQRRFMEAQRGRCAAKRYGVSDIVVLDSE